MPEIQRKRVAKYQLITGQDSYASQVAQNPQTSRRLLSLIPSQAGFLERQQQNGILFANSALPAKVGWLFEYDVSVGGGIQRYFFAATSTALYQLIAGVWTAVTAVNPLANYPTAVRINNLMHLSDGVNAWIFDGTTWKQDGLPIPQGTPVITPGSAPASPASIVSISRTNGVVTAVVSGHSVNAGQWAVVAGVTGDTTLNGNFQIVSSTYSLGPNQTTMTWAQPGFPNSSPAASGTISYQNFSVATEKYYWTTFEDDSTTDGTESSSSPRSLGSGVVTNGVVTVQQRAGTIASMSAGATTVAGTGTDFSQSDVGLALFATENLSPTFPTILVGIIASVTDSQHMTLLTGVPGAFGVAAGNFVIAPVRATNWNIYCSGSESDNQGFFLASVYIYGSQGNSFTYIDQSPFLGTTGSYINSVLERPLRNDPPDPSLISTAHKRRIFRRNEAFPNFFNYSAYEEVLAGGVGDPYQCVPGAASDTISDLVNETSYPDQSLRILNMISYADSLFIGTETNCIPLFGESIDDFVLSQITAFSVGMAGRFSGFGCPYGLGFLSYDKKFYLWPSQWIAFYAPEETSQLIELSRPIRTTFQTILSSDLDNVHAIWYNYGKRNWIVVTFQDNTNAYHTWVFDFEIKGWFELQPGFSSVAVFEPTFGNRVLVGGGTDGYVYVIDDQTGSYTGFNLNYPQGTYRPALIDFGNPDEMSVLKYVEYEVDNPNLNITVNYYLDPQNVDNPGVPQTVSMSKLKLGSNRYRGFFQSSATCDRVLLEFIVASDENNGVIRSITLAAAPASKLVNVPNPSGA